MLWKAYIPGDSDYASERADSEEEAKKTFVRWFKGVAKSFERQNMPTAAKEMLKYLKHWQEAGSHVRPVEDE